MKPIHIGNVHELYELNDYSYLIVKTDRISARGSLLPKPIRDKGIVQTKMTNFWFDLTSNIIPNHNIKVDYSDIPEYFRSQLFADRISVVEKLDILPFEFIVRGYMFGRMWKEQQKGNSMCGNNISEKYKLSEKLRQPIITPTI